MGKTTKTITVRAKIEAIDRFVARCHEDGLVPNKVLADFIAETPTIRIMPSVSCGQPKIKAKRVQYAPLAKPTGFDAITGEPIFKSGVGPQKGKKK